MRGVDRAKKNLLAEEVSYAAAEWISSSPLGLAVAPYPLGGPVAGRSSGQIPNVLLMN